MLLLYLAGCLARWRMASVSPAPIWISPAIASSFRVISRSAFCTRLTISSARLRNHALLREGDFAVPAEEKLLSQFFLQVFQLAGESGL